VGAGRKYRRMQSEVLYVPDTITSPTRTRRQLYYSIKQEQSKDNLISIKVKSTMQLLHRNWWSVFWLFEWFIIFDIGVPFIRSGLLAQCFNYGLVPRSPLLPCHVWVWSYYIIKASAFPTLCKRTPMGRRRLPVMPSD